MTSCGGHSHTANTGRKCRDCGAPINIRSRGRCMRCGRKSLKRPCPDDFLDTLRRLRGSKAAAAHYHASLKTITRWRNEIGLRPHRPATKRRPRRFSSGQGNPGGFARIMFNRDMSPAGLAADHLRKFGAVYRCDAAGKPNAKGEYWNRNGHVLADEDIMSRAARLGWSRPEGMFAE